MRRGVLVIAINAVQYITLSSLSAPIALLNIINFVLVRFHRNFLYALVSEGGAVQCTAERSGGGTVYGR